ncbi:MAG: alpha-glucosidase C-terminal domain-containing protein, partial [Pseudomonadota bacterium]
QHYRAMLKLRGESDVLVKGDIAFEDGGEGVLAYTRTLGGASVFVAVNLEEQPGEISLPVGQWSPATMTTQASGSVDGNIVKLPAFGAFIATSG